MKTYPNARVIVSHLYPNNHQRRYEASKTGKPPQRGQNEPYRKYIYVLRAGLPRAIVASQYPKLRKQTDIRITRRQYKRLLKTRVLPIPQDETFLERIAA